MTKPLTVSPAIQLSYVKNLRSWYQTGVITNDGDTAIKRPDGYNEQNVTNPDYDATKDIIIIPYSDGDGDKSTGTLTMNRANFSITHIDNEELESYQHKKDFLEKSLTFKAVRDAFSAGEKKAYDSNVKSIFVMLTSECARNKVVSMLVNKFLSWGNESPNDAELDKNQMKGFSLQFKDYSKIVLEARRGKAGFENVTNKSDAVVARANWVPLSANELEALSNANNPVGMNESVNILSQTGTFLEDKNKKPDEQDNDDTSLENQEQKAQEDPNQEDNKDIIPETDPEGEVAEKV
ncbi:hypothetical protein [Vibrio splendidus]|uniref:hypothetical protein n=1 Tax=Vibrio splendidus TaxID=29497 RepID=UPI003D14B687